MELRATEKSSYRVCKVFIGAVCVAFRLLFFVVHLRVARERHARPPESQAFVVEGALDDGYPRRVPLLRALPHDTPRNGAPRSDARRANDLAAVVLGLHGSRTLLAPQTRRGALN